MGMQGSGSDCNNYIIYCISDIVALTTEPLKILRQSPWFKSKCCFKLINGSHSSVPAVYWVLKESFNHKHIIPTILALFDLGSSSKLSCKFQEEFFEAEFLPPFLKYFLLLIYLSGSIKCTNIRLRSVWLDSPKGPTKTIPVCISKRYL